MQFNYSELPLHVVALSTDRENGLPEYFEKHRRPEFVAGWVGPPAMQEVFVDKVPAIFVLDADHTVVFFTNEPQREYELLRDALDGLSE